MYFLDNDGSLVWGRIYDLDTAERLTFSEFSADVLDTDHMLVGHDDLESRMSGVFLIDGQPVLVASVPILRSDLSGPIAGTFILGRFFDEAMIETLRDQTRVQFDAWPVTGTDANPLVRAAMTSLPPGEPFHIEERGPNSPLLVYTQIADPHGTPALMLRTEQPRSITAIGRQTRNTAVILLLVAGALVMAVTGVALRRVAISPIEILTQRILEIGRSGDLRPRTALPRKDEIGILSREFDKTIRQLAEARQQLMEHSYYSGMAETAAGVLHNIRNSLTPIAVHLWKLDECLSNSRHQHLDEALGELQCAGGLPERQEKLLRYVKLSVAKLLTERREMAQTVEAMARQNEQIKLILEDHAKLTRTERRIEPIELSDVIDEMVRLIPKTDLRPIDVRVQPDPPRMPAVRGHRIVLSQVLGNLLMNAMESIQTAGAMPGEITIAVSADSINQQKVAHLEIRDNGQGIEPQNLKRIFQRGFSTKKQRSGGLGLHWCANSITSMGGRIYATSDGLGTGATFHVLLPLAGDITEKAA
jgi:signal transduction histidine kinase